MFTAVYRTKRCIPQASHTILHTALRQTDPLWYATHSEKYKRIKKWTQHTIFILPDFNFYLILILSHNFE
jgi:hypothetical protein